MYHPVICCLQETHFKYKDTYRLKGWRKNMLTLILKKAGVAILISDRAYFKARNVIRDKGHYIMKRGSILQEDTVIFNVCAPNNSVKLCKAKLQNCKEKYMQGRK